jgi:hypothetical protein
MVAVCAGMSNVPRSVLCLVLFGAVTASCTSETLFVTLSPVANSGLSGRVELHDGGGGKTLSSVVESWVKLEGVGLNSAVLNGELYSGTCDALGPVNPRSRPVEINKMTPAGVYGNKEEQPAFDYLIDGDLDDIRDGKFAFVVYVSNSKRPVACGNLP